MKVRKYILKFGMLMFFAVLFLIPSIPSQAAVKKLDLLQSFTRRSCQADLDGDGKNEDLKLTVMYDEYHTITNAVIYVDGQKALAFHKLGAAEDFTVDYIKMSDSNIFVRCYAIGPSAIVETDVFCRYDPGSKKLVKVKKLLDVTDPCCTGAKIKSVTGSEVKVDFYCRFDSIGYIKWTGSYVIKDGNLKLKTSAAKAKNQTTTKYGDPDGYGRLLEKNRYKSIRDDLIMHTDLSMKTVAYHVYANDIITLKKIQYKNREWYVQFEKNGKKGWLDLKSIGSMELFYGVWNRMVS